MTDQVLEFQSWSYKIDIDCEFLSEYFVHKYSSLTNLYIELSLMTQTQTKMIKDVTHSFSRINLLLSRKTGKAEKQANERASPMREEYCKKIECNTFYPMSCHAMSCRLKTQLTHFSVSNQEFHNQFCQHKELIDIFFDRLSAKKQMPHHSADVLNERLKGFVFYYEQKKINKKSTVSIPLTFLTKNGMGLVKISLLIGL